MARKMAEGVYLCPKCETLKYAEDFYTCKGKASSYCKPCLNLVHQKRRAAVRAARPPKPPKPTKLRRKMTPSQKGPAWVAYNLDFVKRVQEEPY